jgi:hypothetical protein
MLFQRPVVSHDVRFATARTVYGRLGDWLPLACLVALAAELGAGVLTAVRPPRTKSPRA